MIGSLSRRLASSQVRKPSQRWSMSFMRTPIVATTRTQLRAHETLIFLQEFDLACSVRVDRRPLVQRSARKSAAHSYANTAASKKSTLRGPSAQSPSPRRGEGGRIRQCSFRFGTGVSNCAISAVCGALPLKVSTLPSTEIATRSPSTTSPARIISASGSCR